MTGAPKALPPRSEFAQLRRTLRKLRKTLSDAERTRAERAICRKILHLDAYRRARTIAVFLAFDGEPSLGAFIETAARHGKQLFAPVLRAGKMRFAPLNPRTRHAINYFGIREPRSRDFIDARALDLVLTPLVGFDQTGNRLGVGGGYYDRTFQFLATRRHWQHPKLLGVAFSCQQVHTIQARSWDVRLWAAVTEAGTQHFHGATR